MLIEAKEFVTYTLLASGDTCFSFGLRGCVEAGVRDASLAADKTLLTGLSIKENTMSGKILHLA